MATTTTLERERALAWIARQLRWERTLSQLRDGRRRRRRAAQGRLSPPKISTDSPDNQRRRRASPRRPVARMSTTRARLHPPGAGLCSRPLAALGAARGSGRISAGLARPSGGG